MTEENLWNTLSKCGHITGIKLHAKQHDPKAPKFAFVTFRFQEAIDKALKMYNQSKILGDYVRIVKTKTQTELDELK